MIQHLWDSVKPGQEKTSYQHKSNKATAPAGSRTM